MSDKRYFIGVDCNEVRSIVCTSKVALARFFGVDVSSIKRYLSKGVRCISPGRYLFEESLTKIDRGNPVERIPIEYRKRADDAAVVIKPKREKKVKPTLKEEPIKAESALTEEPMLYSCSLVGETIKKLLTVPMDRPKPSSYCDDYVNWSNEAREKIRKLERDLLMKEKERLTAYDPSSVVGGDF